MPGKIYLEVRENEAEAVYVADGAVAKRELVPFDGKVGNIYRGKVCRRAVGCFVEIGSKKQGYLPAAHNPGEYLTVMVARDEEGEKGCLLTENISLSGKFAIVMSGNIEKFSVKLSEKRKNSLRGKAVGAVFRSACEEAPDEEILAEIAKNKEKLAEIEARARNLYKVEELYRVDPVERAKNIAYGDIIEGFDEIRPLLNRSERVKLNGGGELVFDKTEAMTVIDVNSGFSGKIDDEEQFNLKTDVEAAREAARQIKLRNIGGLIAIDFINLIKTENLEKLERELSEAFSDDYSGTRIELNRTFCVALISRRKLGAR